MEVSNMHGLDSRTQLQCCSKPGRPVCYRLLTRCGCCLSTWTSQNSRVETIQDLLWFHGVLQVLLLLQQAITFVNVPPSYSDKPFPSLLLCFPRGFNCKIRLQLQFQRSCIPNLGTLTSVDVKLLRRLQLDLAHKPHDEAPLSSREFSTSQISRMISLRSDANSSQSHKAVWLSYGWLCTKQGEPPASLFQELPELKIGGHGRSCRRRRKVKNANRDVGTGVCCGASRARGRCDRFPRPMNSGLFTIYSTIHGHCANYT